MVTSDTLLKKIGDKIRVLRTEKGYSQEDLASELNISPSGLAKIERGESDITFKKLEKIAAFFELNIVEILNLASISYYNFRTKNGFNSKTIHNAYANPEISKETIEKLIQTVENLSSRVEKLEGEKFEV
jgi:transcriptional regulator with XRE-family HTH domain